MYFSYSITLLRNSWNWWATFKRRKPNVGTNNKIYYLIDERA